MEKGCRLLKTSANKAAGGRSHTTFKGVAGMIPTARVQRGLSQAARCASTGIVPATPPLLLDGGFEEAQLPLFCPSQRDGVAFGKAGIAVLARCAGGSVQHAIEA